MKKIFILFLLVLFVASFVYAKGNETNECTVDSDCDADEVCIAGECEDENGSGNDDECTVDTDCDADELCVAGECEDSDDSGNDDDECVVDADCAEGRFCIDGDCEDLDDSGSDDDECSSDADCTDGRFCIDGDCEDVNDDSDDDSDDDSSNRTRWIKDCLDDSMLRNMNEIELKIRRAEQAGDSGKVDELKIKMEELALRIRERTEECKRLRTLNQGAFISEAAKLKDGSAAGIVDYYKAKLSEISLEEDEAQRLELLRALRSEIDTEIKTIMESKRQIRSDDMDELVEKIEVRADKIKADDVEVDSKDRSILTEINGKEVEIKVVEGQVKIEVEGVEVDTGAITIENDTLFYNGVAIKTLPSDALVRYKLKVKEMRLEQEENKLVYKVKYEEQRKILGLFKAKAEREAEIDADDGNKIDDNGPWWQWMSTRDGSAETEVETELEVETETTG